MQKLKITFWAALCLSLFLTACGSSDVPPTSAGERPTVTPLPSPPPWTQPSQPISVENIQQMRLLGRLESPGEPSTVFAYALSPDNTRLAALNNSYFIVWDLVTGEGLYYTTRDDETRVFYSPAKDEIYTIGASGAIYIINSGTGNFEDQLNGQTDYAGILDYHTDLGLLAMVSTTGEVRVWEMFDRVALATIAGSGVQVLSIDFSDDGERLVAAYEDGIVQVWDWRNRTPLATLTTEGLTLVTQVRFAPDGETVVGMTESVGIIWDAESGEQRHVLPINPGGSLYLFKFAPQGEYLITGGVSTDATIWDIETGTLASALPQIGGNNLDAAFSPEGDLLLTTLYGTGVTLWNLSNIGSGNIARSTQNFGNSDVLNLLWTDDSFLILMFDGRGPVEVWGIP
jgi:WD40 repeat protein